LLNRVPANRLGSKGDAAELKAHPFFNGIDWVALSRKEVTPPFKPSVESDESTACFDPEFTSADLREVGIDYWDEEEANMVDPTSGQRLYNGPAGSERAISVGSHAPEGAIDLITPLGSYQQPIPTPAKDKRKRRSSSPISSSLQENFRGFSYTASESVDDGWEGLRGRMRQEEELEKIRVDSPGPAEAVGDEEITLSNDQISSLRGEFGEADEAMRRMNLGAGRY
jgi:hypothetical protein